MWHRFFLLASSFLLAMLNCGCQRSQPSQDDVEKSIRAEMKSKIGVDIKSFDLKIKADGSYTGTATTDAGADYGVTAAPLKNNKIEWKAVPDLESVERMVEAQIKNRIDGMKPTWIRWKKLRWVKSLKLTYQGPGIYRGPVELISGQRGVIVSTRLEGTQLLWETWPEIMELDSSRGPMN